MLSSIIASFILIIGKTESYDPYPYNPTIHSIGNHGVMVKVHAELAPLFTHFTDRVVYKDDLRKRVRDELGANKSILDIGCGTGFSTSDAPGSMGIDTSIPMIEKARRLFPNKMFSVAHGEHWNSDTKYDIVSAMFCFHEIPQQSRKSVIQNCLKYAKEKFVVIDIAPNYTPNPYMLAGEPYLPDYLDNIRQDLSDFEESILYPNHVHMWCWRDHNKHQCYHCTGSNVQRNLWSSLN